MVTASLELWQRESVVVTFVCGNTCPAAEVGFVEESGHAEGGTALGLEEDCALDAGGGEVASCGWVIVALCIVAEA